MNETLSSFPSFPTTSTHRCGPGGQAADEGQQSPPGLPAPRTAPVSLPRAAQLMAATGNPCCCHAEPRPLMPPAETPFLILDFVLGSQLSLWGGPFSPPLSPPCPALRGQCWPQGLPRPFQPPAPCPGAHVWVENLTGHFHLSAFSFFLLFFVLVGFFCSIRGSGIQGEAGFLITFNELGMISCRFLNFS